MTALLPRLLAAESHLRRTAGHLDDGLRDEILAHADAVAEAHAILYQKGCRENTGPVDINNPPFIPRCGPEGAYDNT
jgi:hypothetical protein